MQYGRKAGPGWRVNMPATLMLVLVMAMLRVVLVLVMLMAMLRVVLVLVMLMAMLRVMLPLVMLRAPVRFGAAVVYAGAGAGQSRWRVRVNAGGGCGSMQVVGADNAQAGATLRWGRRGSAHIGLFVGGCWGERRCVILGAAVGELSARGCRTRPGV
jgi:hypothetical protein